MATSLVLPQIFGYRHIEDNGQECGDRHDFHFLGAFFTGGKGRLSRRSGTCDKSSPYHLWLVCSRYSFFAYKLNGGRLSHFCHPTAARRVGKLLRDVVSSLGVIRVRTGIIKGGNLALEVIDHGLQDTFTVSTCGRVRWIWPGSDVLVVGQRARV